MPAGGLLGEQLPPSDVSQRDMTSGGWRGTSPQTTTDLLRQDIVVHDGIASVVTSEQVMAGPAPLLDGRFLRHELIDLYSHTERTQRTRVNPANGGSGACGT